MTHSGLPVLSEISEALVYHWLMYRNLGNSDLKTSQLLQLCSQEVL